MMRCKVSLRTVLSRACLLTTIVAGACTSTASDHLLSLNAQGLVFIQLYRDDNRNLVFNPGVDSVVRRAVVSLRMRGALDTLAGAPTDSAGHQVFRVPVGRYSVVVDSAVLSDSLEVVSGSGEFTLGADDSIFVALGLGFHTISIAEARALPLGKKAWVHGIVMNQPGTFGDSTMHLLEDSVGIRFTSVRPNLSALPGDSGAFFGRRAVRDGQPVMQWVITPSLTIFPTNPLPPDSITSAAALTADGGKRDARLVKITGATISDTTTTAGNKVLTVSDGSGSVSVVLSQSIAFTLTLYKPNVYLDVIGLLAPDPANPGTWYIRPRGRTDLVIRP